MRLIQVCLPITWYTINDSNNLLFFREASSPGILRLAELQEGNYSTVTLLGEIQTKMVASGTQPYVVLFNSISNIISITSTAAFSIEFDQPRTLYYRLGFDKTTLTYNTVQQGIRCLNLSPAGSYFVLFDGISVPPMSMSNKYTFSASLPITIVQDSYEIFTYRDGLNWCIQTSTNNFNLGVKLLDDEGQVVRLESDWSMVFSLEDKI